MDVDAARKKGLNPLICFRCGQPGHKAPDCNLRFDVRALTVDELQTILEDRLAELDVAPEEPDEPEEKAEAPEIAKCQDFTQRSE